MPPVVKILVGAQLCRLKNVNRVHLFNLFRTNSQFLVMQFQIDRRIEQDEGVVGRATWRELFKGVGLPGHDLNKDGLITPNEIVFD